MANYNKPNFRSGEDENYICAWRVFDEERFKDANEDFILPDYLPDVKKIVGAFGCALIGNRFLGSGTLEYEADVSYKILYISEDNELKCAVFNSGFDDKIGNADFSEECVEIIRPEVRGLTVRMINPRKFSIRAQNGANVTVYKRRSCLPELYGALTMDDENALVCAVDSADAVNILSLRETGLTVSEDINFDASMPTAEELIFSQVELTPLDCRLFEGEAQFRGVMKVYCVMRTAGGETVVADRALPFTQSVKNEALHEGGTVDLKLYTQSADVRLREDEFAQKRMLEIDATYLCDLTVYYPKQVQILEDAYSLEKETDTNMQLTEFVSLLAPLKGSFSVNESVTVDLPENAGYALDGIFVSPVLSVSCLDGKILLTGEAEVFLLLHDGAGSIDTRRTTLPLRFKTDISCDGKESFGTICARTENLRARLDKNKLSLDFEVGYYGCVLKTCEEQAVQTLRVEKEKRTLPGKRGSVLLYYPSNGESPFEIAKKYGVRPEGIEKQMADNTVPMMILRK